MVCKRDRGFFQGRRAGLFRWIPLFYGVLFFSMGTVCSGAAQGLFAADRERFEQRQLVISAGPTHTVTITAEIAATPAQRTQGLMYRTTVADGTGMLFVFEKDDILSFWMKNTLVPLSIAFLSAEGRILEIRDMTPQDLTTVRSSRSARYALETPQGWFSRAGISIGALCQVTTGSGAATLRTLLPAP